MKWTLQEWEIIWLHGFTGWWPDSIALPRATTISIAGRGLPAANMPPLAWERVTRLHEAGESYVVHIEAGCHAFEIGFAKDYLTEQEIEDALVRTRSEYS